jgi:uncharacterized membrane protein YoaK (UPF0700 family)
VLGWVLAFVAGAINAGGFLAVAQYTSHVTGLASNFADRLVLGQLHLAIQAAIGVLAFLSGALTCGMLVNFARRHRLRSEYAFPLLLEAGLILLFGLLGAWLSTFEGFVVPFTVMLLCFIMGLQNAIVTKLSHSVVRTTHMTGVVTDLGIELGKLIYWNRDPDRSVHVKADRSKLILLVGLLLAFVVGGITGALGFKYLGYLSTVPVAVLLAAMASAPTIDDFRSTRVHRIFKAQPQRPSGAER